jgi:hypothetical protein
MDRNEFPLEPRHQGVPLGASKTIFEPMVLWRKSCNYLPHTLTLSLNGPKRDSTLPTSPRSSIVCVRKISDSMVCSAQIVHLLCVMISTISKRTKISFHLSLVTLEYHRVHPKRFLSLWYVWRKPCTYLASRLSVSPNGMK